VTNPVIARSPLHCLLQELRNAQELDTDTLGQARLGREVGTILPRLPGSTSLDEPSSS
jgi:hypothetical protein